MSCALYIALFLLVRIAMDRSSVPLIIGASIALYLPYLALFMKKLTPKPAILLATAVAARLILGGADPAVLSDDAYRYLWDGRVQSAGINPYAFPPDSPALSALRDRKIYPQVAFREMRTVYPPLAQAVFLAADLAGGTVLSLKLIYLLFEIGAAFFLYRMTGSIRAPAMFLLFPLLVLEAHGGAHIDIAGACLLVPAIYFLEKKQSAMAAMFLSMATAVKFLAVIAMPVFVASAYFNSRKESGPLRAAGASARTVAVFAGVLAAFYLPYLSAGRNLFSQLIYYNRFWEFNGSLFEIFRLAAGDAGRTAAFGAAAGIALALPFVKKLPARERVALSLIALLCFTHTVYPWYLLWLVPFLSLRIRAGELYLLAASPVSYLVWISYGATGEWRLDPMLRLAEYGPFYLLMIIELTRGRYVQREKNCGDHSGAE